MNIGIFTYGTRGDVQPYIALALGLLAKGHQVTLAAPENFETLVIGYGVNFHSLYGNVEEGMNTPAGQAVLKAENTISLMKYFFKTLNEQKIQIRKSYLEGFEKVDFIIANSATLQITSAIAEKQNKKLAISYFMPPVVPTGEFPLGDFDFFDFPWYNKQTYKLAHFFYWKFLKQQTNEFRLELSLQPLKKSLIAYYEEKKPLDLYCFSPSLIPQPKDWDENHKITGFLQVPEKPQTTNYDKTLDIWISSGDKPMYMGFGSNGIGNTDKFIEIVIAILANTNERILFCTGWALFENMPVHPNLFVTKYINHNLYLPQCKLGIFHGGAGTLAAMLRKQLPVIIISFYTDQPTWGKIVERKKIGAHIPVKKLSYDKLLAAIKYVQTAEVLKNVEIISGEINNEKGLERAVEEIEKYFKG